MRCVLACLVLLAAAWAAEPTGTLIALNKAASTATLIDRASGRTVATLPTGQGPHEVAVSPDGRTAVVTNYGSRAAGRGHTLTVLDLAARKVAKTVELGQYGMPHGIVFLADGKRVVVTTEGNRSVAVVDLAAGKVVSSVGTQANVSHMVALAPDGSRAYVANIGSDSVAVVDLIGGKLVKSVPTGRGAEGIDISPDGKEVWVTNRSADNVSVVDTATLAVVATVPCGRFPIRAKFTPDGKYVLVSCAFSAAVVALDAKARKEAHRIVLTNAEFEKQVKGTMFRRRGAQPIGIVIPPDGKRAYVACGGYDRLAVVDLTTWKVTAHFKTGREPDGLAYSPLVLAQ